MAPYGWGNRTSVTEGLLEEGHRFTFFQVMRILERLFPERTPLAEDVEPDREVARIRCEIAPGFAAGDVQAIRADDPDEPVEVRVNFMGLAGPNAPLPSSFTELVYDRAIRGDTGPRDFLDLFNHRMVSLFYRARKKYRPPLDHQPPHEGRVARTLLAFLGLGTPALRHRLRIKDRSLLPHTGLFLGARSMIGLERLVAHHFGFAVKIDPFHGAWHTLEEHQLTAIGLGRRGRNHALGIDTVLGGRVWEQRLGFEVRCGPLTLRQLLGVLPTARGHGELVDLVSFYASDELDFHLRYELRRDEIPPLRLGRASDARLGWSSRLGSSRDEGPSSQLRLGRAGDARLGWTTFLGPPPAETPWLCRRRGEVDWFGHPYDDTGRRDIPPPNAVVRVRGIVRRVGSRRVVTSPEAKTHSEKS